MKTIILAAFLACAVPCLAQSVAAPIISSYVPPAAGGFTRLDTARAEGYFIAPGTQTASITISSGAKILLVWPTWQVQTRVDSVRIGTTKLTAENWQTGFGLSAELYYLVNPSTGAQTITVYRSGTSQGDAFIFAETYSGVSTSTPFGSSTPSAVNSGTGASLTVTSASGELGLVCVVLTGAITGLTDAGTGQTRVQTWVNSTNDASAVSQMPGAASISIGYTWTGSHNYSIIAVSMKPQ